MSSSRESGRDMFHTPRTFDNCVNSSLDKYMPFLGSVGVADRPYASRAGGGDIARCVADQHARDGPCAERLYSLEYGRGVGLHAVRCEVGTAHDRADVPPQVVDFKVRRHGRLAGRLA